MYIKLSDRKFIVPTHVADNVNKVMNQVARKRERLLEKKQITEQDFIPFEAEFSTIKDSDLEHDFISKEEKEEIKKRKFSHALLEIKGDVPNVDNWKILGSIEPILGQKDKYTLQSYTYKDLPKQYRDLEEPTKCEHCDTNRKRNQTFVIQNKESDEVLQVGSSCMEDFIDKTQLTMLMTYSNMFKEIESSSKTETKEFHPTVSLINKEEFLATHLAIFDKINGEEPYNNHASVLTKKTVGLVFDYFNYLEYPEHWKERIKSQNATFFDSLEVNDEHLDKAEDIVDFFEELDASNFSDTVFNTKEIIGNDFDFLSINECRKIAEAHIIYKAVQDKSDLMLNYLSNYHEGVVIGGEVEILPKNFKKQDFFAALVSIGDKDTDYTGNSYSTELNPSEPLKAIYMISPIHLEKQKQRVANLYSEEDAEKFENFIKSYQINPEHYERVKELEDFFKKQDIKAETSYQSKMIQIASDESQTISESDAKSIGFSYRFYKQKEQATDMKQQIEEEAKKGFAKYVGTTKDRFEEIELKYISRKSVDSDFGLFYIHNMEDAYGNSFAATSQMRNPFNEEDDIPEGQWITISGTIKGHRNNTIKVGNQHVEQKQTQLNRIKPLSEFHKTRQTDGEPVLKGKYTMGELMLSDYIQDKERHSYTFKDKNDKEYKFLSTEKLYLDKGEKIEAGFMLSGDKKEIYKVSKDSIRVTSQFSDKEFTELTPRQLEKKLNDVNKKNKEQKATHKPD